MAETYTRRISIYVDSGQALAAQEQLLKTQDKVNASIKKYTDAGKEIPDKLKKQLDDVTTALDRQNKKISGELSPSLKDLTSTAQRLRNEMKGMSEEDPLYNLKKGQLEAAESGLKKVRSSLSSVKETFSDMLKTAKGVAFGVLIGNTVQSAVQTGLGFLQNLGSVRNEFEGKVRNLSAITGATGQDLEFLKNKAIELSTQSTKTASDFVEAMKLIGSAKPELLNDANALAEVTKQADRLAKASGLDLPDAATRLTDALNQYGAGADEAAKFVDILAAAAKYGAAEVPGITEALLEFGPVAKQSNVNMYESAAAIELLAEKGVKGAEAGTKLRNVLLTLSAVDSLPAAAIEKLKQYGVNTAILQDKTKSLADRLTELSKVSGDANAMMQIFDKQNIVAGQIMLENIPRLVQLNQQIHEGGVASKQASENTATLSSAWGKFTNTLTSFILKVDTGWLTRIVNDMTDMLTVTEDETAGLERERRQLEINLIALQDHNLSAEARRKIIDETNAKYSEYLPNLLTEKNTMEEIRDVQIESNKQMMLKIFAIKYQKELNEILDTEAQAREGIVNSQIAQAKLAENAKDIGMGGGDVQKQKALYKNAEELNKQLINGTGKRIDELKNKYTNLAKDVNASFEEMLAKLNSGSKGGSSSSTKSSNSTAVAAKVSMEKDLQAAMAALGKQNLAREEQEYQAELLMLQQTVERKRLVIKADYAQGITNKEEYEAQLETLEIWHAARKLDVAENYKDGQNKATADAAQFDIDYQDKVLQAHIRVNDAIANSGDKTAKKVKQSWQDSYQGIAGFIENLSHLTVSFWETVDKFRTQSENNQFKKSQHIHDEEVKDLDRKLKSHIISQTEHDKRVEALDKALDKKKHELDVKQFKRQQALGIVKAIISGGEASMKALADYGMPWGLIPMAVIAGITAAEVGVIATQEPPSYGSGGIFEGDKHSDESGGNPVIDPETGRVIAKVEKGEAFIPADSTAANPGLISALINARGRSIADKFGMARSSFNVSRTGENLQFANGGIFNGSTALTANTGSKPKANNSIGITDVIVIEMMERHHRENMELLKQVKDKPVKFVKYDFDRFNNDNDIAYTRTNFGK